jgi:hypothetical protein
MRRLLYSGARRWLKTGGRQLVWTGIALPVHAVPHCSTHNYEVGFTNSGINSTWPQFVHHRTARGPPLLVAADRLCGAARFAARRGGPGAGAGSELVDELDEPWIVRAAGGISQGKAEFVEEQPAGGLGHKYPAAP